MAYENAPGDLRQKPQELGVHQQHNLSTSFSVEYWLQEKTCMCVLVYIQVSLCAWVTKTLETLNILIVII